MTVLEIPIALIDPPNPVLRLFSEMSRDFLEIVDQIGTDGNISNSICVRPIEGGRYQVCDGHRRYRATIVAGNETIPCIVREMDDHEYLATQVKCNAGHTDTDWVEYAVHLDRLRNSQDSEMNLSELSNLVGKGKDWVSGVLRLNNLHPDIAKRVRRGEIPIGNAKALARLPRNLQPPYFEDARVVKTSKFEKTIAAAFNSFRESINHGSFENFGKDDFRPQMRDLKEIESELGKPSDLATLLVTLQITDPLECALMGLKWAFRVDPVTLKEREEKVKNETLRQLNRAEHRKQNRENMRLQEKSQE